jgi:glycosyltransferase
MKVSIITAVYNNQKHIAECVKSVVEQDYENLEYIIIDGNSSDNTLIRITPFEKGIKTIVSEPDQGLYDALNKGVSIATGDVIGFLHSDDILPSKKVVSKIAQQFREGGFDAVYGDLQYVKESNLDTIVRNWKSCEFEKGMLRKGWMPPHPSLYVKKKFYQKLGGFNINYKIAADYDWMLRLFSDSNLITSYIPEVIVKMRIGGKSNGSIKGILQKTKEDYIALRENDCGGIRTLLGKNLSKLGQFF